jgi:hypothetical protein
VFPEILVVIEAEVRFWEEPPGDFGLKLVVSRHD